MAVTVGRDVMRKELKRKWSTRVCV